MALSPWNDSKYTYAVGMVNLGNNFIDKLEIVSALNSFNISAQMIYYDSRNRTGKYYPKIYFGAFQTASRDWNFDYSPGLKSEQKSGSLRFNF